MYVNMDISKSYPCYDATYKTYKNKLVKILRMAERDYYQELLHQNKANLKNSWRIIKDVLNKHKHNHSIREFNISGKKIDNPETIDETFNSFFTNIGPNISAKLPNSNTNPLEYINTNITTKFHLTTVEEVDIKSIVSNLKDSSSGPDGIPPKIIKLISTHILKPLTHTVNLLLKRELKTAKVIPILASPSDLNREHYFKLENLVCTTSL